MDTGTYYTNAHHRHANTETIVGHTTISTGADPAIHGMVGNVWLDRASGDLTYNVEDARYPILSKGAGIDQTTEIDPTQKTARTDGRSPSAIMVSTFSDELNLHNAGQSKIFAVSVKDRGAISMAGHTGKAFWFSKKAGEFITSSFYYDQYPDWVKTWNDAGHVEKYSGATWELMQELDTYLFAGADDRPYEVALPGYGVTFPHAFGDSSGKYFTTLLTISPVGDELTLDFAKNLILMEDVGDDNVTDYLSVSFSSTDYVGHFFGPSSLEAEDNILRLDQTVADLLQFIDHEIGLNNVVIVLSADHGGPETPGYLNEMGFESDIIEPENFDKDGAIERLKQQFGIGEELITRFFHPYLYLNREVIVEKGLDLAEVEQAVANELMHFDGVSLAVSSSALRSGNVPNTPLMQSVLNNYNPSRSGDIYIVFEPNRFIADFGGLQVAATHGSPWRYDTYVPIIFAGTGIAAQRVNRMVNTVSIAPTLSQLVGTKPPTGAFSQLLYEVANH
jgi:predicted AlkP superfamily pyrophosphatase or phosphodiesterase